MLGSDKIGSKFFSETGHKKYLDSIASVKLFVTVFGFKKWLSKQQCKYSWPETVVCTTFQAIDETYVTLVTTINLLIEMRNLN